MDSVRFGRALGTGARGAAKALAGAVDAATAPNPRAPSAPAPPVARGESHVSEARHVAPGSERVSSTGPGSDVVTAAARGAARVTVKTTRQAKEAQRGVVRGTKRFGEAIWGPFVKLSGVLWLEITGAFFGIFALFAGQAVWVHRADLMWSNPANRDARPRAMVFLGMALLFGYFCVSSFVRARRRERSR